MAAPTITRTGTGTSKTAGLTLLVTVSTTTYSAGDYVVVAYALDPVTSNTVTFSKTGGTAVVGAFSNISDQANGTGTSGARCVGAYAKITTGGTITQITCTNTASITAKAASIFRVQGADGTTPVILSGGTTSSSAAPQAITSTDQGKDLLAFWASAGESAGNSTVTVTNTSGWSAAYTETLDVGTTGQSGASNMSISVEAESRTRVLVGQDSAGALSNISGNAASVACYFQFIPSNAAPSAPTIGTVTLMTGTTNRLTITWTDENTSYPVATYSVLRGTDGVTFPNTVVSGQSPGVQTVNDTVLPPGTYFYKVRATNTGGTADSGSASGTITAVSLVYFLRSRSNSIRLR